jgi:hypothetical protein
LTERGLLSLVEFFAPDDDDRTDRCEYLDVNSNGHLVRVEWHGTPGESFMGAPAGTAAP